MATPLKTPWKSDKWFVSPWNFAPEVMSGLEFPRSIAIHDITLRDGEQQAGIEFTRDDKIRIAAKLAEAGVHRIEAGMPAVSAEDERAIRDIVKMKLGPKIFAFARCMKEDVKRAADCGVDGVVVEIPSSEHIIQHAYRWPLQKAVELSIEATRFAHECGLYTVFFPIDATRAELGWFLDLITRVANEGHMDALVVVDTFGGCSPHAIPYLIKKIRERVQKPLETHFHDDFGLAAANTILALAAGAEVAHTTVSATGERAGNAAYEDVVLSLLTMYGVDLGIKTEKLCEVSRLVQELARVRVRPNRPIVGEALFNIESGIITTWFKNCGYEHFLELSPFRWELVGQAPARSVLGKSSGLDSLRIWLQDLGIECPDDNALNQILQRVKTSSMEKKGLLSAEEFKAIVAGVAGR